MSCMVLRDRGGLVPRFCWYVLTIYYRDSHLNNTVAIFLWRPVYVKFDGDVRASLVSLVVSNENARASKNKRHARVHPRRRDYASKWRAVQQRKVLEVHKRQQLGQKLCVLSNSHLFPILRNIDTVCWGLFGVCPSIGCRTHD